MVDTLGFDVARRRSWLSRARTAGLPAVLVLLETPDEECRRRNAQRDRPLPARVLTGQLRRAREVAAEVVDEGWDMVVPVTADVSGDTHPRARGRPSCGGPHGIHRS